MNLDKENKKGTVASESSPFSVSDINSRDQLAAPSRPPFGYYGAKQRIATKIIASFPPHNAWVEAFAGSAAITLAKKPAPIEIVNDLDGDIVNVFKQLRENSDALCRAIALTPYAREEYFRARHDRKSQDPLERARQFVVATMMTVNSTAVNGLTCGFSYSQSYARSGVEARVNRWYNLPERLMQVIERLRKVRIESRDAREIVRMFLDRPATLMYLDPPYFVERAYGYAIDAKDEPFHRELLELCCKSRAMLIVSGYKNKLYDSILTRERGWRRSTILTLTRDTKGKDHARTEVLWKNAQFVRAKADGRIQLRLTRKEIEENKINPPRKK